MLTTILAAAVVLGIVILVHELGHFWAAKLLDVRAPRFSIGLGPKAFGVQWGETEYVISWLPLGGYVQLAGMGEDEVMEVLEGKTDEDEVRGPSPRDFNEKPLWSRGLILSAGVLMNFAFAFLAYAGLAATVGVPTDPGPRVGNVYEEWLPEGTFELAGVSYGARVDSVDGRPVRKWSDVSRALMEAPPGPVLIHLAEAPPVTVRVPRSQARRDTLVGALSAVVGLDPVIRVVQEDSPASEGGLVAGDRILEVAGTPVENWAHFVTMAEAHPGEPVRLLVQRGDREVELTVTPEPRSRVAGGDTLRFGRIGVSLTASEFAVPRGAREAVGPGSALVYGASRTWRMVSLTVGFVAELVTGRRSGQDLGGPIMIGQISGQMARAGLEPLVSFMAFISVQLGILNLLPIPVLDGGHLMFLTIEGIRGRAVSPERRARWMQLGMLFLAVLMVWVIVQDIFRIVG